MVWGAAGAPKSSKTIPHSRLAPTIRVAYPSSLPNTRLILVRVYPYPPGAGEWGRAGRFFGGGASEGGGGREGEKEPKRKEGGTA